MLHRTFPSLLTASIALVGYSLCAQDCQPTQDETIIKPLAAIHEAETNFDAALQKARFMIIQQEGDPQTQIAAAQDYLHTVGLSLNIVATDQASFLDWACEHQSPQVIQALLEAGLDMNWIYKAPGYGPDCIKSLMRVQDSDNRDKRYFSDEHIAAVLKVLVEKSETDAMKDYVIQQAALAGWNNPEALNDLSTLVIAGSSNKKDYPSFQINGLWQHVLDARQQLKNILDQAFVMMNQTDTSAGIQAAQAYLAAYDLNLHTIDAVTGLGFLERAIKVGSIDLIQGLLDEGVECRYNYMTGRPCSLLAINPSLDEQEVLAILHVLDRNGIDLKARMYNADLMDETNVMSQAAFAGYNQVIDWLIEKGLPVDMVNAHGNTPIANAISTSQIETIKHLLARGADVNHVNKDGATLLQLAALTLNPDVVEVLEKHIQHAE